MLIGNKADSVPKRGRQVTRERGQALADALMIIFFETSAESNIGIDDAFLAIARALKKINLQRNSQVTVVLDNNTSSKLAVGCWNWK